MRRRRVQQAGTSRVVGHFNGFVTDIGDATLVSIANPRSPPRHSPTACSCPGRTATSRRPRSEPSGPITVGGLPELTSRHRRDGTAPSSSSRGTSDTVQSTAGHERGRAYRCDDRRGEPRVLERHGLHDREPGHDAGLQRDGAGARSHPRSSGPSVVEVKITAPSLSMGSVPRRRSRRPGAPPRTPMCKTGRPGDDRLAPSPAP